MLASLLCLSPKLKTNSTRYECRSIPHIVRGGGKMIAKITIFSIILFFKLAQDQRQVTYYRDGFVHVMCVWVCT